MAPFMIYESEENLMRFLVAKLFCLISYYCFTFYFSMSYLLMIVAKTISTKDQKVQNKSGIQ
jgi:hypothetical protein